MKKIIKVMLSILILSQLVYADKTNRPAKKMTKDEILTVIKNGSSGQNYPMGAMPSGMAWDYDAERIATWLSNNMEGDRPEAFAICAGCHGEDGKGLNGMSPDISNLKVTEEEKNLLKTRDDLVEKGMMSFKQEQYQASIENIKKALLITKKLDKDELPSLYYNLGFVYYVSGDSDNAIKFLEKSKVLYEDIIQHSNNKNHSIANKLIKIYDILAEIYEDMEKYENALKYYKKSFLVKRELKGMDSFDTRYSINHIKNIEEVLKIEGLSDPFLQTAHKMGINSIDITPTGKQIVSASDDRTLRLWDIKSGKLLKTYIGHSNFIKDVVISPDGKYIASASWDKSIRLWNLKSAKTLKVFSDKSKMLFYSVKFSKDGKYLLAGGAKKVFIWDIKTKLLVKTLGNYCDTIASLVITPNGKLAIFTNGHKGIEIWDIKTGEQIKKISNAHLKQIYSLDISLDGKYLVSGSQDKSIKIWDMKNFNNIKTLKGHTSSIYAVSFSPNGKYIISGAKRNELSFKKGNGFTSKIHENTIKIWDMKSFKELKTLKAHSNNVTNLKFNKDSKVVFSASRDKTLKIWDIISGKELNTLKGYMGGKENHITKTIMSKNGKFIVTSKFDKSIVISNVNSGRMVVISNAHDKEITTLNIIKNKYILSTSMQGIFKLWDIKTGKLIKTFEEKHSGVLSVLITPDEKKIISSSPLFSSSLKVWSVDNGKILHTFNNIKPSFGISLTPNGKSVLIATHSNNIRLLDIETGNQVKSYSIDDNNEPITLMKVTPDGKFIVYVQGKLIKVIDIKDGKMLDSFFGGRDGDIFNLDITPNSKYAITAGEGSFIKLWDLKAKEKYIGEPIKIFRGHRIGIISMEIIRNGKSILSAGMDKTLKLWDIQSGKEIATIYHFENNDWLTMTKEGYFSGSRKAMKYINMNLYTKNGIKPFDFSQLYDHFFRPDLVKLKLSGDEEAYQKAIKGMSYQEAIKNPPPKLSFKSIDTKETNRSGFEYKAVETKKEKVKLTFNVKEHDGGGIGLIRIYQEGKLIQTIGEGKVNKQSANVDAILEQERLDSKVQKNQREYLASLSKSVGSDVNLSVEDTIATVTQKTTSNQEGTYTVEIELKSGKNDISIEAFNKTNTVTSYRENITINADIPKQKPKLYAIVAGVNEFEAPNVNNLKYSQNDAKVIKEAVESKMSTLFKDVEVIYLTGKEVTKANILKAAQDISKKAKLNDTVLFYISTHGRAAKGKLYLVPYNNKSVKNWIDFEQTFQAVQSIKALNQIFVIDACESGKANDIVSAVYDSRASVLAKSSGVHMLLATTKGTSAFEHPNPKIKNGVFTYRILQALKDKSIDTNKDKTISILELSKKLKEPQNNADYQYPVIRNVGRDVGLERVGD